MVLATGADTELPERLWSETTDGDEVAVDLDMLTSVENAFAVGSEIRDRK